MDPSNLKHSATQTDEKMFIKTVPVRVTTSNYERSSTLIEPHYLEAVALLMSDNLSASEAVRAVHTIDTIIWGQKRHLPLRLDKSYMNAVG